MTHYEFVLTIEGTTLVITIRWYASAVAADPIHTDVLRYSLTDSAVTAGRIEQEFRDRGAVIRQGVIRYTEIQNRFGGLQNTRLPFNG